MSASARGSRGWSPGAERSTGCGTPPRARPATPPDLTPVQIPRSWSAPWSSTPTRSRPSRSRCSGVRSRPSRHSRRRRAPLRGLPEPRHERAGGHGHGRPPDVTDRVERGHGSPPAAGSAGAQAWREGGDRRYRESASRWQRLIRSSTLLHDEGSGTGLGLALGLQDHRRPRRKHHLRSSPGVGRPSTPSARHRRARGGANGAHAS